jgi:short subunit dehydrogenase-like uncharacterized protein
MSGRIVLFGATGYTGRIVASSLVEIGERPVLAGRDPKRLESLADSLGGLETATAEVGKPESLRRLLEPGDILVSTVGPFTLYGSVAVDAALSAKAHYLDSTGEPAFIRSVFEDAGPRAERDGTTLLTAFGVDWVPGNVAGARAVERSGGEARRLDIGYLLDASVRGGSVVRSAGKRGDPVISTGTRASLIAASADPQHAWRRGRLVLEPAARHLQAFRVGGAVRSGTSVGGSEAIALPKQYPELEEVNVYMEWPGPPQVVRGVVLGFSTAFGAIARTGPGRRLVERAVAAAARTTGGGPSPESREHSGTLVAAVCRGAHGATVSSTLLSGDVNGYTLTGRTLAWGAAAIRAGEQKAAGARGPVEAFGLDESLAALSKAGLEAEDLSAE